MKHFGQSRLKYETRPCLFVMDKASSRAVTIRRLLSQITAVSLCLCGALCSVHLVACAFTSVYQPYKLQNPPFHLTVQE
ncbi:hypothetical protein K445DRAFT_319041 [Daldinia sp. EC12]|nr:hypothetical protein F4774DRAFT_423404 [Daldinia eschscholtzii]OTB14624.1 hypothetical protein K445DRAFT_319041 [Daldinia sp. EC12]